MWLKSPSYVMYLPSLFVVPQTGWWKKSLRCSSVPPEHPCDVFLAICFSHTCFLVGYLICHLSCLAHSAFNHTDVGIWLKVLFLLPLSLTLTSTPVVGITALRWSVLKGIHQLRTLWKCNYLFHLIPSWRALLFNSSHQSNDEVTCSTMEPKQQLQMFMQISFHFYSQIINHNWEQRDLLKKPFPTNKHMYSCFERMNECAPFCNNSGWAMRADPSSSILLN